MKFVSIAGVVVLAATFSALNVSTASASSPAPSAPPTAAEFALTPFASQLHPGEKVAPQPDQEAWQRELAKLAREGHATSVTIDAATGIILSVTASDLIERHDFAVTR